MASIRMTPQELRDSASFLGGKRDEIVQAVNAIKQRVDAFPETIQGIESILTDAEDALEEVDSEIANAFKGEVSFYNYTQGHTVMHALGYSFLIY